MKLRKHLTYANVAATLALAGVIGGGGAYAAGMIGSGDIRDNSIRSKDLKNRAAVKARDVKRDGLTGREIREHTLRAAEFAPLAGGHGSCDPNDAAMAECAVAKLQLRLPGRVVVIATGEFVGDGDPASLMCRVFIDGKQTQVGAAPGQSGDDVTALAATDGLATTLVSGRLPRGVHTFSLGCAEGPMGDGRLDSATIAVLGISG